MIVENKTSEGGLSSFILKYVVTKELIEFTECYSPLICIKLGHTSCTPELSIYAKDMASEVALA